MDPLLITGVGLASSLGTRIETAAAAFRAGLSRASSLEWLTVESPGDDDAFIHGHPARPIVEGMEGLAAWRRLALLAWGDLSRFTKLTSAQLAKSSANLGVLVVLPAITVERFGWVGDDAVIDEVFLVPLLRRMDLAIPAERRAVVMEDQRGTAEALRLAQEGLRDGRWKRVLVIAVDSYLDQPSVDYLTEEQCLKTSESSDGLIPGEAGVCLLLESTDGSQFGASTGVQVNSTGGVSTPPVPPADEDDNDPSIRRGPPDSIAGRYLQSWDALTHEPALNFAHCQHYLDLTGEAWRAHVWGYFLTLINARLRFDPSPRTWLPAGGFGETGAASAALAICLATQSYQRGYASSPDSLIWSLNRSGDMGVIHLTQVIASGVR